MKFTLIIDPSRDEEVVATVHRPSALTQAIQALVQENAEADRIPAYIDDDIKLLAFSQIECITVIDGKTYAIDRQNRRYRLKQRLYELEAVLPDCFLRINKSTLANESCLDRFSVTYSGGVDAVFKCGYREYVSRRCFAQLKRRFDVK